MRIRWTVPAANDLEDIETYLRLHYPRFAKSTIRTIFNRILALKSAPYTGRPGSRPGTREAVLVTLPYVIIYTAKNDCIEILHIHHGAQDWR